MASGITVNDECVSMFNELKSNKKHRFVIFKVSDDQKQIVVDQKSNDRSATWDDFKHALPRDEPRYAIFDLEFSLGESGERQKVILISWVPETATVKKKMLYSSSKSAIKQKFVGVYERDVQATDLSELDHTEIINKIKQK